MKLISWNVNGLRSVLNKGALQKLLKDHQPDILCLQETKMSEDILLPAKGYSVVWNHAQKKGYAGTAILSKVKILGSSLGMGIAKHDNEGRVLTAELKDAFLVNVYVPNSKRDLSRLPYRSQEWDVDFLKFLKALEKKKPVIFCGDLNVAHTELDLTYPKSNVKNHGFTPEERAGFDALVKAGFVDTFRDFETSGGHHTWWSPMGNCRAKNIGWRIDYFCISKTLRPKLKKAAILKDVMGSDHCPVEIEISIS